MDISIHAGNKIRIKKDCQEKMRHDKEFKTINLKASMTVKDIQGMQVTVKENRVKWHLDWIEKV